MLKYSYLYPIPYIALTIVFFLLAIKEHKIKGSKSTIYYCGTLLFAMFFGTANYVGPDVFEYNNIFDQVPIFSNFHILGTISFIEPGYLIYVSLVKSIWSNFHFFVFVSTIIDTVLLFLIFRKYSPNVSLSFAIVIVMSLFLEISLYRNMKAILIVLFALQYIQRRKFLKYLFVVLLASTFHLSALFFLPLYFFLNRNCYLPFLIIFIIGIVIYFGNITFFSQFLEHLPLSRKYLAYFNSIHGEALKFSIGSIERILTAILLLIVYKKYTDNREYLLFFNSFMCYFFLFFFFWNIGIIANRGSILFQYSYWLIIPIILYHYKGQIRIIFTSMLFVFSVLKISATTNRIVYKYESVLMFDTSSRYERETTFYSLRFELFNN